MNTNKIIESTDLPSVLQRYESVLQDELTCIQGLSFSRSAYEDEKSRVVNEAIAAGEIDMKNADTRKQGEFKATDASAACYWLQYYVQVAQSKLDQVQVQRKIIETEISLTKAWLYSQGGKA